jgi:hypothetical protein
MVVALRRWVVGCRGSVRRGWPAVAGGRVLGREGVRAVLGVVQMWPEEDRCGLASQRLSATVVQLWLLSSASLLDNKLVGLGLEGGGGARGATARVLKAQRYGAVDGG